MSIVILLASGTAWAVSGWVSGQMNRSDVFGGLADEDRPDEGPTGARTILVLGSDQRHGGETPAADEPRPEDRSDTMMLIRLHADREHVSVVGVPRDSWVPIPGHEPSKVNAAYSLGGPALAIQTLESNTGIRIDHYVEANFNGFVDIVDALGGVEVCLPEPIYDEKAHLALEAGTHEINGTEALGFARTRKTVEGDLDRIDRQHQLLSAMFDRALSSNTLSDPARLTSFLDAALGSVTVDESLDTASIRQLADQMSGLGLDDVSFTQVPIDQVDFRTPSGESAVTWNSDEADALFQQLEGDQPLTDAPEPDADQSETVAPSEVTVEIYNGAGIPGLGAQAREALRRAGYEVPEAADNWSNSDVQNTQVRHAQGQEDIAESVAERIPGAELVEDGQLDQTITVVLGFNFETVEAPEAAADEEEEEPAEDGDGGLDRNSLNTNTAQDHMCS